MISLQKNEKIFIDTSGLVGFFLESDAYHSQAKNLWKELKTNECRLFVSEYVFDELVTLLLARSSHQFACKAGQSLIDSELVDFLYVQDDQVNAVFQKFKKYQDKRFSFTDVCSFYLMELEGIQKAFTFDRHFSQAGFTVLL